MQVKFYLGQNEDCSPGDSTAGSSERLLQRGTRKCHLGEGRGGGFSTIKPLLYKRFSSSHKELVKGYSNFLDMRRYKDSDHEISS